MSPRAPLRNRPRPLKGETTVVEPSRAERAIARRTAEVRATVPDLELRRRRRRGRAARRGRPTDAYARPPCWSAPARTALRAHPRANAAYRDGRYELYSRVNVAVTVADRGRLAEPDPARRRHQAAADAGRRARDARRARAEPAS